MTQEEKWLIKYNEVVEFINTNHRNPSKHRIEEHDKLNWVKQQRKLLKWIRGRFFDPHPRSSEAIEGLAAYRGGQAGCNYAEAFEVVMRRI